MLCYRASLAFALALLAGGLRAETIDLFNGEDLSGWEWVTDDETPAESVWSASDGVLRCTGTPRGYIQTTEQYSDYVLELEWRWPAEPGNSGVLLHTSTPGELGPWPKSLEAQLMNGNAGDIWAIGVSGETGREAKGRRTMNLVDDAEMPTGEWNRYVIVCVDETVTLIVNGRLANAAWDVTQSEGKICLQSEGAPIEFRNVRLSPLDD